MSQEMPIVYPVSETAPTSNHSSNGSYGAVFVVLAVIVILSAFACFLGRLFNKHQNVQKSSSQNLPTKEKLRNAKDGDIEFGPDNKKFGSAKVAATADPTTDRSEPTMDRSEPKMVQPNSFHEPITMSRPNSFQEPNKMGPSSFGEPVMGRPADSFQDPYKVGPNSYREPAMGRPDSFQEPTMGRPNSFDKGEYQGDHQTRFDVVRDNKLNFVPRTRLDHNVTRM